MTNLIENGVWVDGVFQLETNTPPLGGPPGFDAGVPVTGHANAQAAQLANRTKYLKDIYVPEKIDEHNHSAIAHPELSTFITSEADRAENAADAAQVSGNIYVDTTSGLAATISGQYFSVPSAVSTEYLILYKNNTGVAVEVKRYPSSELVSQMDLGNFPKVGMRFVSLLEDTGYAWALVDSTMRAAILVTLDGTVEIPKLNWVIPDNYIKFAQLDTGVSDMIAQPLNAETGFVWAVLDQAGKRALAIDTEGTVHGKVSVTITGEKYLQSTENLYFLGDSLTAGAGGQVTWREALPPLVSARQFTNIAIGGQTSPQIAARADAYVSLITLQGDVIPASGPVNITSRTISLLTNQGAQSISGYLSGVRGTIARNGTDDSYTFTRSTAGTAVPVGRKIAFSPDISANEFDTWMIFIGANNISQVDVIKRDISACVDRIRTVDKRFIIMTPVTGNPANVTYCEQIEEWASQTYRDRVLRIREFSFQFNDGTTGDLEDVAAGVIPRSLRIDTIHFTTAFHAKIAELVADEINRRGW